MIIEILQWLQLLSVKNLNLNPSLNISNLILVGYLFAYTTNRKGCFIAVFIFCELIGYTGVLNSLDNNLYYLVFAGIYSCFYHFLLLNKTKLSTVFACVIIVLFTFGASLDACFYTSSETFFNNHYELLVVGVHFYFIYTIINWRILRKALGQSADVITSFMGINYTAAFFCYTYSTHYKKAIPRWY